MSAKPTEICASGDVAAWLGLEDRGILGAEPIPLTEAGAAKLKAFGPLAELSTFDAAAILRSFPRTIRGYTLATERIRLGHRYDTSRTLWIPAADLAAFIVQKLKPPVPTTGRVPTPDSKELADTMTRLRDNHGIRAA